MIGIDIEKCKKEFLNYVSNFDFHKYGILRKYEHSLRVMNIARDIAISLKMSDDDVELATLCGLLHDFGRFEQVTKFSTFSDIESEDHAEIGVRLLFNERYIRKFISDDKFDDIICLSVKYHNKYEILSDLDERTKTFCKIVRDADKLDIYEIIIDDLASSPNQKLVEEPSMKVLESLNLAVQVHHIDVKNSTDEIIRNLEYIYDIYFEYSFKCLIDSNAIGRYISLINMSNHVKEIFDEQKSKINEYMTNKLEDMALIV